MTIRKLFSRHSTTKAHTNSQWLQYAQDLFRRNLDKIPARSGGADEHINPTLPKNPLLFGRFGREMAIFL